jgi:hypothetical protein
VDYIVEARHSGTESIISFHHEASQVHDLAKQLNARLLDLGKRVICRFEYDYKSETADIHVMDESPIHHHVKMRLRDRIKACLARSLVDTEDAAVRQLIRPIEDYSTIPVMYEDKLFRQADIAFGQIGTLPSLVCEVS